MFMSTEKKTVHTIPVPSGVNVAIEGDRVSISGSLGTNKRKFNAALVEVAKEGDSITVTAIGRKKLAKRSRNVSNAARKEIENDITGVGSHFEVMMETVFSHFPITVEVKGKEVHIKNILGERVPRTSKIVGDTKIEVKDKMVRIYGINRDDVSQTAANIREACKTRNKDERVFQDGVYYSINE